MTHDNNKHCGRAPADFLADVPAGASPALVGGRTMGDITTTVIPYARDMRIVNTEQLGKGTGARYLEVVPGGAGVFVAKQWRRSLRPGAVLVDFRA